LHFSNRNLQRGTTHQLGAAAPVARPAGEGATAELPAAPKNNPLSKTIVLDIETTPFKSRPLYSPSQTGSDSTYHGQQGSSLRYCVDRRQRRVMLRNPGSSCGRKTLVGLPPSAILTVVPFGAGRCNWNGRKHRLETEKTAARVRVGTNKFNMFSAVSFERRPAWLCCHTPSGFRPAR
jgi:hypothetical protein